MSDRWYSYECFNHGDTSASGVVFDVRIQDGNHSLMKTVKCPICGGLCEQRGNWEADANGYGSRGDNQVLDNLL